MKLNQIRDRDGARHKRRRVGRGIGSGRGKTAGRGHKGQKSRTGVAIKGFEGGQMPLTRRVPKHGFRNIFAKRFEAINLDRLQQAIDAGRIDAGQPVTPDTLKTAGLASGKRDGMRLLARGELTAKLDIAVHGASKAARAAVEKAGGRVSLLLPEHVPNAPKAKKGKKKGAKTAAAEAGTEA